MDIENICRDKDPPIGLVIKSIIINVNIIIFLYKKYGNHFYHDNLNHNKIAINITIIINYKNE